jgi:hypothetical protein
MKDLLRNDGILSQTDTSLSIGNVDISSLSPARAPAILDLPISIDDSNGENSMINPIAIAIRQSSR